jgi:O-methyltransferase
LVARDSCHAAFIAANDEARPCGGHRNPRRDQYQPQEAKSTMSLGNKFRQMLGVPALESRIQALEELRSLESRIQALEEEVYWRNKLFYKAYGVSGLWGDYLEFGVFTGHSLSASYWSAKRHFDAFMDGAWDHATRNPDTVRNAVKDGFMSMRFIGFDSFEGLPAMTGVDAERAFFEQGTYSAGEDAVMSLLKHHDVNLDQVRLVKGFFEETCTEETARSLALRHIAVVHVDSDLYSSARTALDFCTPYFRDGSVVIFDEWFQFHGSPNHGEQRAFKEWREANEGWHVAELGRESFGRIAFVLNKL